MDILSGRKWTGSFKELRKLSALRDLRRGSFGHSVTCSPSVVFLCWRWGACDVEGVLAILGGRSVFLFVYGDFNEGYSGH